MYINIYIYIYMVVRSPFNHQIWSPFPPSNCGVFFPAARLWRFPALAMTIYAAALGGYNMPRSNELRDLVEPYLEEVAELRTGMQNTVTWRDGTLQNCTLFGHQKCCILAKFQKPCVWMVNLCEIVMLLWMEEFLHQLINGLSHYL